MTRRRKRTKRRRLRGWNWFLGRCLVQERNKGPLAKPAKQALDHSLLRRDETSGHVLQACGATQKFLLMHPNHKAYIRNSSARPFDPKGLILSDWDSFMKSKTTIYGRKSFRYNLRTLRGYLTRRRGGNRQGGGGGDYEFKIVLRLMADFM
jgi:hypothetical protein